MNDAGTDARRLPEHLAAGFPGLLRGAQAQALRQILLQNYHWNPAGRLRWRDDEGDAGLPPPPARIVSPCDPAARCARRGQVTRWAGYLAHVTQTCGEDGPDVITDVATMPATSADTAAVTGIHARLERRRPPPPARPAPARPPGPPPGPSATQGGRPPGPPPARSLTPTARATAATGDSPKPTCSPCSPPSRSTSSAPASCPPARAPPRDRRRPSRSTSTSTTSNACAHGEPSAKPQRPRFPTESSHSTPKH